MKVEHSDARDLSQGERVKIHSALGDKTRLSIADALAHSDRRPGELADLLGIRTNLLAHHLDVLEAAGVIVRTTSHGDARGKYLRLRADVVAALVVPSILQARHVLFVCTHNSARSQIAAAVWNAQSEIPAESAGADPAPRVHPEAVRIARRHGLDLRKARPRGYAQVEHRPDILISVCDRARESLPPFDAQLLHWSIPDPVETAKAEAFDQAFNEIADRVDRVTAAVRQP